VYSLRQLEAAVPASAVVLDEDKDGAELVGARYMEAAQTGV
jgi:hypothetical protein